jgi:hypothetical protein
MRPRRERRSAFKPNSKLARITGSGYSSSFVGFGTDTRKDFRVGKSGVLSIRRGLPFSFFYALVSPLPTTGATQ